MLLEELASHLRCPDCLSENVAAARGSFTCTDCGRVMAVRDGVIYALPAALDAESSANLSHYEEMAQRESSHLDQRSLTRNHRIKIEMVLNTLRLRDAGKACTVLELGMGSGSHGAAVADCGHEYIGVDIAPSALRRAAEKHPSLASATLVAGDATRLPIKNDQFDRAFCVGTLHHLPEPLDGLREVIRSLARGGRFCVLEPKRFYPAHFVGYVRNPQVEIGTLKVSGRRFARCLRELGVSEFGFAYCVYTPNRPAVLLPLYDVIDKICESTHALHWLSVMCCVHGTK